MKLYFKIIALFVGFTITLNTYAQETNKKNSPIENKKLVNNKFNISVNAVYAYRYDINTDFSTNHLINDISKQSAQNFGWQADVNLAIEKKKRVFLGLQYETNWSDCGVNSTYFISSNRTKIYSGDLTLQTQIKGWGLNTMIAIAKNDPRRCFYFTFGVHNLKYSENLNIADYNLKFETTLMGISYGFKYIKRIGSDWGLCSSLILNKAFTTSGFYTENGSVINIKLPEANELSISRFSFSVGAKYFLGKNKN